MGGLRRGSVAKRAAIGVFALYALLLQAFFASSTTPAAAFSFGAEVYNCTQGGTDSGVPGEHPSQHHGLCCILACAAAACHAYLGSASSFVVYPAIADGSKVIFAPSPGLATRPPVKFFFAARGPPQNL